MITITDIAEKINLTEDAVRYRIRQLGNIDIEYVHGTTGAIRVFTEEDLQAIINYRARKPGRKRRDG